MSRQPVENAPQGRIMRRRNIKTGWPRRNLEAETSGRAPEDLESLTARQKPAASRRNISFCRTSD